MARRNEHSLDEIREMILDAAESIIINEGYSALTVRKITKKIGYTVASIYMVFTGMAELILQIKTKTVDDLSKKLQQVPNATPEQHINDLASTYLLFAVENFNRWSMIHMPDTHSNEQYHQLKIQLYSPIETDLARLAHERSPECIKQAARTLWHCIHGICSLSLTVSPEALVIKEVQEELLLLIESFIAGWKSKTP